MSFLQTGWSKLISPLSFIHAAIPPAFAFANGLFPTRKASASLSVRLGFSPWKAQ